MNRCLKCDKPNEYDMDLCKECNLIEDLHFAILDGRLTPTECNKILASVGLDPYFEESI